MGTEHGQRAGTRSAPRARRRRGPRHAAIAAALVAVFAGGVAASGAVTSAISAVGGWFGTSSSSAAATGAGEGHVSTISVTTTAQGTTQVLEVPVPGDPGTRNRVDVFRPPVPDSRDLPVLYFLHGVPGQASDVWDAGLPQLVERFVAAGNAPFVLVAPDGNGVHHADTEWVNAVDGTDQMDTFVTDEVIDAVEGANRRDREHRAIAGFSMGGYGAINLAMRHPDLYGQVATFAGYFHVDDPSGMLGKDSSMIEANSPELHVASLQRRRVFVLDGDQDDEEVVKGEPALFFSQLLSARVSAAYSQTPGGHTWQWVAGAFPTVEQFLEAGWRAPNAAPIPTIVSGGGTYQGTVGGVTVRVTIPAPSNDPYVQRLDAYRRALDAPPASYVLVTLENHGSSSYTLSHLGLVTTSGLTIEANEPRGVTEDWAREGRHRGAAGEQQAISGRLAGADTVAPGATKTSVYITSTTVPDVASVFIGESYGSVPLTPVASGAPAGS